MPYKTSYLNHVKSQSHRSFRSFLQSFLPFVTNALDSCPKNRWADRMTMLKYHNRASIIPESFPKAYQSQKLSVRRFQNPLPYRLSRRYKSAIFRVCYSFSSFILCNTGLAYIDKKPLTMVSLFLSTRNSSLLRNNCFSSSVYFCWKLVVL